MAATLHAMLADNAAAFPDRPWLRYGDDQWTYAQGAALADRIAAGLAHIGVGRGDRVALLFANCPQMVFCYFACFKLGAIAVPINTRFQPAEVAYALADAQARVLIGQSDLCAAVLPLRDRLPHLAHVFVVGGPVPGAAAFADLDRDPDAASIPPDLRADEVAALLYTSGTTAKPKGVIHTHATLLRQNANLIAAFGAEPFAVTAIAVPLCHIGGFSVQMLVATEVGGTLLLLPRFEPEMVLHTFAERRASYCFVLPTHINMLLNHPGAERYDLSALQLCLCGGDCLPTDQHARFKALFGVDIDEGCGMTEVVYAVQPRRGGERRIGSIGKPIGDVRIRLEGPDGREVATGEAGEIVVFSGAVTPGYWNDAEATAAALRGGGMHSGDLARRDEDGFYWFMGRSKDIIIRGGSNVSPGEVEDVLYGHPAVYEAGVVGVPCPELGERIRAYVALKPGSLATEAELIAWSGQALAAYKVPESIVFAPHLPKGPTGKVLRRALRTQAAEGVN